MEAPSLSPDQLERRRRLWFEYLTRIEPDARDRIQERPEGDDAVALAVTVELEAQAYERG